MEARQVTLPERQSALREFRVAKSPEDSPIVGHRGDTSKAGREGRQLFQKDMKLTS